MKRLAPLGLLALAGLASAAPVNISVFSTGAGLNPGDVDSNWTIDGGAAKVSAANPAWTGGSLFGGSNWINIDGDPNAVRPAGVNVFSTTFDLTGLDFTQALLNVTWSSDNGSKRLLNGVQFDALPGGADPNRSYQTFKSTTLTSGFVAGLNTLSFVVANGDDELPNSPGPIGLKATVNGTAPVPEPASMAVLGLGLAALKRRRARKQG